MSISKKLSITFITSFVVVGMFAFATPAHAGFFNWFQRVDNSAQAIRAIDREATSTFTDPVVTELQYNRLQRVFNTSRSTNQCQLTSASMNLILDLMDDTYGATAEAIDAVDDLMSDGFTNITMTGPSGLSQSEINQITTLLTAFGCDASFVYLVNDMLSYQLGGGACDEDDIEVSITGNTPEGVQPITQFDVLEFTIENNSQCDVFLEDLKVAYMTTDGKPYFDEIQVRDENGAFLGENDELQTDPNFDLGDRITISLSGGGYEIQAGDFVDLTLRLVNYNQPVFDNTVPYDSYRHKYLLFGFIDEDDFDFKWNNASSFGAAYTNNNLWGERVQIPMSSLSI